MIGERVAFNVIGQRREGTRTKQRPLVLTTSLDRAVTIPYTAATHTVEYSIQYVNPPMVGILSTQRWVIGALIARCGIWKQIDKFRTKTRLSNYNVSV